MIQSIPHLTNGAIYDIMINKKKIQGLILQVIQIKEMRGPTKKYKIALSDGEYYTSSILSNQLNAKIDSGDLQTNSIVILNDYQLMETLDKDILIIQNVEPFCLFSSLIGHPNNIISISSHTSQNIDNSNNMTFSQRNNQNSSFIQSQNETGESSSHQNNQNIDVHQQSSTNTNSANQDQKFSPNHYNLSTSSTLSSQHLNPPPHQDPQPQTDNQNANQNQNQQINSITTRNHEKNSEMQQPKLQNFFNATQNTAKRHSYKGIDILNPYIPSWMILARVVMKGSVFNYNGRDGKPGKLLNITLKDKTGSEIRGTFFNDQVTIFEPLIEQDKIYQISGGLIKEKNPRFNTTPHDYEISFNSSTKFVPMPDDHTIGTLSYHFKKLAELPELPPKTAVDIIAYVISVSEIQSLTLKDSRTTDKREIVICDDSNVKCDMTLWDKDARDFPNEGGFIVAFKEAKITDFKGRTLSSSSAITINPTFSEAHHLQSWIDQIMSTPNFDFDTMATVSNGGESSRSFIYLSQINDLELGTHEKPDYGVCFVTLSDVMLNRKLYYTACPNPECRYKGLTLTEAQSFFCERCQRIVEEPAYRYNFSIKVQDFTGSTFMSFLGDDQFGAIFTGMSAQEWHDQTDGLDETEIRQLVTGKFFMGLKLRVRMKSDSYSGRSMVKTNVFSGQPLDFAEGARFFANEINKYS